MAIPHSSQQPSKRRRWIVVSLSAAIAAGVLAVLARTGLLAPGSNAECPPAAAASGPACEPCPPEAAPATVARAEPTAPALEPALGEGPAAATTQEKPQTLERYSVCEAASSREPVVRLLALHPSPPAAVGVHCGDRIELIAFDDTAPRRIATLTPAQAPDRNAVASAGGLLATDISGDGAVDLVVGFHRRDEQASPRSGALYEIRRTASGSFGEPRTLAPLHVGGLLAIERGGADASDLAVLHLHDARLARANEVVSFRGGPAPVKLGSFRAGVGMSRMAAADLDLDTHPDLIMAGDGRPSEAVYLDARGAPQRRATIDGASAPVLLAFDIDADSHRDILIGGPEARVVLAGGGEPLAPLPVPELRDVLDLHAADLDGDGRASLVGRRGSMLVELVANEHRELSVRELTAWPDSEFLLRAVVAFSQPRDELILIASPVQARGRVELWRAGQLPLRTEGVEPVPMRDAPWMQRLTLP